MASKETSFRIGCGRYIQGKGYIEKCGEEVLRLGNAPLIIGGKTALSLTQEKITASLSASGISKYEFITHESSCNDEDAQKYADIAKSKGYDVIIGTGGGVIMDIAKLCGHFAHLPVINIPTSSATCAAYTPLSVRYTPEGRTVGTMHFDHEINCVIADTAIICTQPPRLLLSGVFDALAKFVELKHWYKEGQESFDMGLDYAYTLSKHSFDVLCNTTAKVLSDIENGDITFDVENLIFTTIAATAVISGISRGSKQTALGHKLYERVRYLFPLESKPYLHGEIVGVGLLMQNHYNGEEENNDLLLSLMNKYNMPSGIAGCGIEKTKENHNKLHTEMCGLPAVKDKCDDGFRKFSESFEYLWNLE